MSMTAAIPRPVQWLPWCGGSVQVSATIRAVISAAIDASPGLRVLSRSRRSTPLSAKRCCERHTVGRLTPMLCATSYAGCRSAEASTNARPLQVLPAAGCGRSPLVLKRNGRGRISQDREPRTETAFQCRFPRLRKACQRKRGTQCEHEDQDPVNGSIRGARKYSSEKVQKRKVQKVKAKGCTGKPANRTFEPQTRHA
jgi:hypothetical protein